MNGKPTVDVSIVAPNHNHAGYLPQLCASIIESSVAPLQLIVVDDASTDASRDVIESFASRHDWIVPVFLPHNQGVANAANAGLDAARGRYVMRLDSDDYAHPQRIARQYSFLESHPEVAVCGGNCHYFSSTTGKILLTSAFPTEMEAIARLFKRGENGVLNGTTMVRAEWLQNFRYRQEMAWAEDYDLFARMLHGGAVFAGEAEPLTYVRIHTGSATSNLEFATLEKAYRLSQELFGNVMPAWRLRQNFQHLKFFRKALLAASLPERVLYLALALAFRPEKLLKRLVRP